MATIMQAANAQKTKIEFTEFQLKNGLRVILHEDHSTPIVAVGVMYHVGSKNEKPNRTGFAHFFEHLMFEGSENIGRGEISKYIESAGGRLNAYTSQDKTYYHELLPSNQLELALWIESERMLHAKIDTKGIETQREVVKEEKRQRYDNQPYGTAMQEIFKRAYKVHPYRWIPIGSMEDLNAASEEDFKDFYKNYYIPNNAVLVIAGDINIQETKKLIEKYFGDIPKGKDVVRPPQNEPQQTQEIRDTIFDKNIQLPAVIMGYHIPAIGTPDYYAVSMLSKILADGESSRLVKRLVNDEQKALYAGSFPFPLEHPGLNIIFAVASMESAPEELEKIINDEIKKLQNELISDEELLKLKNKIEADFVSKISSMEGIAEKLADYKVIYGDANLINTEIDRYLKVTKEDIRNAAKKYFTPQNRVVLYYLPDNTNENKQ